MREFPQKRYDKFQQINSVLIKLTTFHIYSVGQSSSARSKNLQGNKGISTDFTDK